uniref:Uncharacterized protein n=1 Tax=Anopheles braziliensis TaxID=58242 RepID=A0A2M3ZLL5_9DIPT
MLYPLLSATVQRALCAPFFLLPYVSRFLFLSRPVATLRWNEFNLMFPVWLFSPTLWQFVYCPLFPPACRSVLLSSSFREGTVNRNTRTATTATTTLLIA